MIWTVRRHTFDMRAEFDIVNDTFCTLAEREKLQGEESITDIERVVLLIWHASGIIGNGGFHYFFECGLPLRTTADAYARIGVDHAALILRRLLEFFPSSRIPEDYDARMATVSRFYEERADLLRQMESEFYATDGLREQQLAGWIRVHRDVFHVTDAAEQTGSS